MSFLYSLFYYKRFSSILKNINPITILDFQKTKQNQTKPGDSDAKNTAGIKEENKFPNWA